MLDAPAVVNVRFIERLLLVSTLILGESLAPVSWVGAALIIGADALSEVID